MDIMVTINEMASTIMVNTVTISVVIVVTVESAMDNMAIITIDIMVSDYNEVESSDVIYKIEINVTATKVVEITKTEVDESINDVYVTTYEES